MMTQEDEAIVADTMDLCLRVVQAVRDAFPHFADGSPVTPEKIVEIGREYAAMAAVRGQ